MFHLRPMRAEDLPAVRRIRSEVYPSTQNESDGVLLSRLQIGRRTCFVVCEDRDVRGYLIGHPWDTSLPLPSVALDPPGSLRTAFVHDLALLPAYRGKGFSVPLVEHFMHRALTDLGSASLVAVNDSVAFWGRRGFRAEDQVHGLFAYGENAVFMTSRG